MTEAPACCKPSDTLDDVARLMLRYDCGEIPVCDGSNLLGVITDRDIVLRAVATGKAAPETPAGDVMSTGVYSVHENANLDEALDIMEDKLVRRLPVIDKTGTVIGIVSQADLIAKVPTVKIARTMKLVSKKTRGHARGALIARL